MCRPGTRGVQSLVDAQKSERGESDMLVLVLTSLYWTQAEGGCSGTVVSISGYNGALSVGQGFTLSCEFTCLGVQHVAQLWRNHEHEDGVSLINITSLLPNVSLVLSISFATKADAGYYSCMTQPPDTISPTVLIQVAENLTTSTTASPLTASRGWSCAAGLKAQIWFWLLLGKSSTLLVGVAFLALRYRKG